MFEEFQRIGKYLFQERLVDSHGGNMSIRQGDKIFITRRDAMLGDLREQDIIGVGVEAGENDKRASRELPAHRSVYKQTGSQAIIHAHPAEAIAISITDNKVVPQDAEGLALFKAASIVRVRDGSGAEESARLLPSFFANRNNVVVMIKGHGSFAVGKNLEEAYRYTSALENSCKVIIAVRASGGRQQSFKPSFKDKKQRSAALPPAIGVMGRRRYNKR